MAGEAGASGTAEATLRMVLWPASVRVYVRLTPCDMRRSFEGPHALVRDHLRQDAFGGHPYLFSNRPRDRVKLLNWDRDGFAVWGKRLEEAPTPGRTECASGIDLHAALGRKGYMRPSSH